jgi:hypothetical protein
VNKEDGKRRKGRKDEMWKKMNLPRKIIKAQGKLRDEWAHVAVSNSLKRTLFSSMIAEIEEASW